MIRTGWNRFVFNEYQPSRESLVIFRLLLSTWLLAFWVPRYQWIGHFPDLFFDPPIGPTIFSTGFPAPWFFVLVDGGAILALFYLIAGRRVAAASLLLSACLLIGNAWAFSFGKINHEILIVLAPVLLAAAGWSGRGPLRAWPLSLLAFTIALAMFTAAAAKLTTGWLETDVSATFGHAVANAVGAAARDNAVWQFAVRNLPAFAWEAMDYSAVLMEASFLVLVFKRRTFWISCALASLFHLGVALLMRITFVNILAYGAFVQWDRVASAAGARNGMHRLQAWLSRRGDVPLLAGAVAFAAICLLWHNPIAWVWARFIPIGSSLALTWVAALGSLVFLGGLLAGRRPKPAGASPPVISPPIILFDGFCGLCNAWVDFILRVDRRGEFRFIPLQSDLGRAHLLAHSLPPDFESSIVLLAEGRALTRSSAIMDIMGRLSGVWRICALGRFVPLTIRDRVYDYVAARRYRWVGRRESCRIPSAAERSRFL